MILFSLNNLKCSLRIKKKEEENKNLVTKRIYFCMLHEKKKQRNIRKTNTIRELYTLFLNFSTKNIAKNHKSNKTLYSEV